MQFFTPKVEAEAEAARNAEKPSGETSTREIEALQDQIDAMQQQLKKLGEKSS